MEDDNIKKLTKEELAVILNVKKKGLQKIIDKKQLEERLNNVGYVLIDKVKEGRKVYYNVEQINENKQIYNNLCKYVFNTNKAFEFAKYYIQRVLINDMNKIYSNKDISDKAGVTTRTINTWDKTLIDNDIMRKDGFFYICIDNNSKTIYECTKYEYVNYCKNLGDLKTTQKIRERFYNNEISLLEFEFAIRQMQSIKDMVSNKYYYRIHRYINNKDNQLYNDTIKLITNLYSNNGNDYNIELEE